MEQFFTILKPLFRRFTQSQVDGLNFLVKNTADMTLDQRAYLFATAFHETAKTMQPITEYGGVRYFDKYDTGRIAAALGNTPAADGDGYKYRGRGYVQLTGYANYHRATYKLGQDFINNPDLALDPLWSIKITKMGMKEGWFTGKKLDDYINSTSVDFREARRIVNGVDKATTIAGYAYTFRNALATLPKPVTIYNPFAWLSKLFGGR